MPLEYSSPAMLLDHGFDSLIDVRSPGEYAEDHIPGAINLPVLNDAERARVGTLYRQNPFEARKIGAALVFRNAADHVENSLMQRDGGWRPLVYCWRGGQRSGTLAWMLREIGWRSEVIAGGYRSWRRLVKAALYDRPLPHRLVLLDGDTGTAKTALLHRLAARGVQVVDLEGLANHRGSLLGARPGGQPAQKGFETALAARLARLDPARPVLVEAESNKIGERNLPPSLWAAMRAAPRIRVSAPIEARARFLDEAYDDVLSDAARLKELLDWLRPHRGHAVVDGWFSLIDSGERLALTRALIEQHYDLAYRRSRKRAGAPCTEVEALSLDASGVAATAARIEAALGEIVPQEG
ncbi:tRNA 2-selenouridine(34) synthase MnmH [Pontibaca methylaminivorans]|uniref:tRNA 2-selenouridine(34) synthase MnmH n=1 Tax=Pontibaca methylaminivorans TaxID=515897 RepID=UPI002FDA20EA